MMETYQGVVVAGGLEMDQGQQEQEPPSGEGNTPEDGRSSQGGEEEFFFFEDGAGTSSSAAAASTAVTPMVEMRRDLVLVVRPTLNVYPLRNYTFGVKERQTERDASIAARMMRYERLYKTQGPRASVDGVLLVHEHNHPEVLLLQIAGSYYKLPGGKVKLEEDEMNAVLNRVIRRLAPPSGVVDPQLKPTDLLGEWFRINFEPNFYPYCPPHITKPKESRKIFLFDMPERCEFSVPNNWKLIAVPLLSLFDNAKTFGPMIASLPQVLARFHFNFM